MNPANPPDDLALLTAEEVLRTIYGDDLTGCTVSLEKVAGVISEVGKQREIQLRELLSLYQKVIEAVSILSTPPDKAKVSSPEGLQALITQRLDTIHDVAQKTITTTAAFHSLHPPKQD